MAISSRKEERPIVRPDSTLYRVSHGTLVTSLRGHGLVQHGPRCGGQDGRRFAQARYAVSRQPAFRKVVDRTKQQRQIRRDRDWRGIARYLGAGQPGAHSTGAACCCRDADAVPARERGVEFSSRATVTGRLPRAWASRSARCRAGCGRERSSLGHGSITPPSLTWSWLPRWPSAVPCGRLSTACAF
jgi:hypothetical protein